APSSSPSPSSPSAWSPWSAGSAPDDRTPSSPSRTPSASPPPEAKPYDHRPRHRRPCSPGAPSGRYENRKGHAMTDTLTAPSWASEVLESVPRGFLAHDWQPATGG